MRLAVVDEVDHRLLDQIIKLGDRHRDTLGFLPRPGFVDRAAAGTIIAAESAGQVLGYALYDLPGNTIRLVHLCIDAPARGQGLTRRLVSEIEKRHPDRLRIRLRCRRDFPAHHMWPRLGFVPVAEVSGRSAAGLPLTVWQKPLREHLSLFDLDASTEESKLIAAIDTNVFFDLIDEQRRREESLVLREDWVAVELELVVTDELVREIDSSEDPGRRREGREARYQFPRLAAAPAAADAAFIRLVDALGNPTLSDRSRRDLQHVAHTSAGGADYLVTRDGWLLRAVSEAAERSCSVMIRSPGELALEVDRRRRTGAYRPGLLAETALQVEALEPGEVERLAGAFVAHGHGERRTHFVKRLRLFMAEPQRWSSRLISNDRSPVALVVWSEGEWEDEIAVLRVAPPGHWHPRLPDNCSMPDGAHERATPEVECASRSPTSYLLSSALLMPRDSAVPARHGSAWSSTW